MVMDVVGVCNLDLVLAAVILSVSIPVHGLTDPGAVGAVSGVGSHGEQYSRSAIRGEVRYVTSFPSS
jgi:hypothetical protein